jgi:hypothetical protein
MGSKFKPRQQRKPRSMVAKDMILTRKGGPMKDKRDKRSQQQEDSWKREWESESDHSEDASWAKEAEENYDLPIEP